MIELRWLKKRNADNKYFVDTVLQFRERSDYQAAGEFSKQTHWTQWRDVPTISTEPGL